jgi:predicted permease
MASSTGSQLLGVLALCIFGLFALIIFVLVSAQDYYSVRALSGMIMDVCQVEAGSFGGWVVLLIIAGIGLIVVLGTVSLVRYAVGQFKD